MRNGSRGPLHYAGRKAGCFEPALGGGGQEGSVGEWGLLESSGTAKHGKWIRTRYQFDHTSVGVDRERVGGAGLLAGG